jgi:F-type H+-transporting ATPase subunit b
MKNLRAMTYLVSGTVMFLLVTTALRAAEGGSPAEQPIGITFKWIHFVILALIFLWLFAKILPPMFGKNADTISSAITKATAAKAEADRRLDEAVAKLAGLDREVATFRATAQQEAAAEMERLRAATKRDAEKISLAAKAEIQAAERAARLELKAIAAKFAVEGAESVVRQQMTPAVQESLISSFVKSLQGRPN